MLIFGPQNQNTVLLWFVLSFFFQKVSFTLWGSLEMGGPSLADTLCKCTGLCIQGSQDTRIFGRLCVCVCVSFLFRQRKKRKQREERGKRNNDIYVQWKSKVAKVYGLVNVAPLSANTKKHTSFNNVIVILMMKTRICVCVLWGWGVMCFVPRLCFMWNLFITTMEKLVAWKKIGWLCKRLWAIGLIRKQLTKNWK